MTTRLKHWFQTLQKYGDSIWYAPLVSVLAALDSFIIIVPTDGLLVGASILGPKRWAYNAFVVTLGSTLGAVAFAALIQQHGLPFLLNILPDVNQSQVWNWTDSAMDEWGAIALFLFALSPLMQHPAVTLAALAGMPLTKMFWIIFAGRIIKYLALSWISSHAPRFLHKLWGMEGELVEVGIKPSVPRNEKGSK